MADQARLRDAVVAKVPDSAKADPANAAEIQEWIKIRNDTIEDLAKISPHTSLTRVGFWRRREVSSSAVKVAS